MTHRWQPAGLVVLVVAAIALVTLVPLSPPVAAQPPQPGVTIEQAASGDFTVVSAGRFALQFGTNGISGWYDLRRDPARQRNLVASGAALLDQRLPGGTALSGAPQLVRATPLRAVIRTSGPGWEQEYTVWAAGQVTVVTSSPRGVVTALQADPAGITGSALQAERTALLADGRVRQEWTLFLDAWTGDGTPQAGQPAGISAITARTALAAVSTVAVPQAISRQPRLTVSGWGSGPFSVTRAGQPLVSGVDYLSDLDPASGDLTVQYLGLIAPDADQTLRTFAVRPAADPAIRLSIQGRTDVNEAGELVVDGNMPSSDPDDGTQPIPPNSVDDIFRIPYIQRSASVTLLAAVDNRPAGSGVRFLVDGYAVATIYAGALQITVNNLAYGEHRAQAVLINVAGQPIQLSGQPVQSQINPLGRGVVLQSIGDSITAGKYGGQVAPGPVTSNAGLPADLVSADGRNFPQYDNYWSTNSGPGNYVYFKGYQVELNTALEQCQAGTPRLPIFILNDGLSGLRAGKNTNKPWRQANRKVAAYRDHIQKLGVEHTLLMLGTNDALGNTTAEWENGSADGSFPNTGMNPLIDQLQAQSAGLKVWLATVPWRSESAANDARGQGYNARIPSIIAAQGSQIGAGPDMYALFLNRPDLMPPDDGNPNTSPPDGYHPNAAGLSAMANAWKNVLCPAMPAAPQPTATPTITPTPQSPPTPGPSSTPTATPQLVFAPSIRR